MNKKPITPTRHETLVFERRIAAPPEAVFAAYADLEMRTIWTRPSPTAAVVYESDEFQVGGEDTFKCGSSDDLRFAGTVRYMDIVAAQRIVYSELISADEPLAASLVTWNLFPDRAGTRLVVTDQVASFIGDDMIDGSHAGMNAALNNLVELLEQDGMTP
jgi:uncharacterized protein YndB with AHSA1/START domain